VQEIPPILPAAWLIYAILVGVGVYVFGRAAQHIASHGGKVRTSDLGLPELLMSLVIAGFFAMMMIAAIRRQSHEGEKLGIDLVLPSSFIFVGFTVGILCFLRYGRQLRLRHVFGIDQVAPLPVLGWACGLILATFPLAGAVNFVTMLILKDGFAPQPLVKLFSQVAHDGDYAAMCKIFISGVLIQPACEEFLFRGFFYGVWKRYLNPLVAGFLACLLFAAFHTSLPAFAGLFVLAVCFNIAYERTGSLLVPIGMHALFNFSSLFALYVQARFAPAL
jgi:membrane protease YdiL (CAAX protease family)